MQLTIIIIVVAFLVFIGFLEYLYHQRIKDLELKLMSKNVGEYEIFKPKKKDKSLGSKPQPEKDELTDPFEITPVEALKALKKEDNK